VIALPYPVAVLRLVLAVVLGALVGFERERGERSAGLRTLALVSLGSALFMIISAYGFGEFNGRTDVSADPSRIAAQVVTGIGFLGAGAILLRKEIVRGLTTAAAIWLVAGIGLACGIGMIAQAATATVLGLLVLAGLHPLEKTMFSRRASHLVRLQLDRDAEAGKVLELAYEVCTGAHVALETLESRPGRGGEMLELRCRVPEKGQLVHVVRLLRELDGVEAVRADLRGAKEQRSGDGNGNSSGAVK
jgi:putative Mg2+ transporter-C (MgtC) family protein